jgi:hypothetical protein
MMRDYGMDIDEAIKAVRAKEQAEHRWYTDEEVPGQVRAFLYQKYIERGGTEKADDMLAKTLQFAQDHYYVTRMLGARYLEDGEYRNQILQSANSKAAD